MIVKTGACPLPTRSYSGLDRGTGESHALKTTAISTNRNNSRAFLLYSNHGYHVVDWTYGLARKLDI